MIGQITYDNFDQVSIIFRLKQKIFYNRETFAALNYEIHQ